jgi:hypothetical protein
VLQRKVAERERERIGDGASDRELAQHVQDPSFDPEQCKNQK